MTRKISGKPRWIGPLPLWYYSLFQYNSLRVLLKIHKSAQLCLKPSNAVPFHSESLNCLQVYTWAGASRPLPCPSFPGLYHPSCPLCSSHAGFLTRPHTHHLCIQLWACARSNLLLEWPSPDDHMALSFTAPGLCSNVTLLDSSSLAIP